MKKRKGRTLGGYPELVIIRGYVEEKKYFEKPDGFYGAGRNYIKIGERLAAGDVSGNCVYCLNDERDVLRHTRTKSEEIEV